MAWRGCWGWTLGSVYSGCPICKGKQCFLAIMKFQPRELRVSVEIDDVPSLPNMYSRRTLPFFFFVPRTILRFQPESSEKGKNALRGLPSTRILLDWFTCIARRFMFVPPHTHPICFLFALFCVVCVHLPDWA